MGISYLIVDAECLIRVLNQLVDRECGVVWLDDCSGDAGRRVHSELQLTFFAIIGGETFEEERAEARTSTAAEGVED